jgi:Family of unknown function (DUF6263)/Wolframin C-terminal OB-fold domain
MRLAKNIGAFCLLFCSAVAVCAVVPSIALAQEPLRWKFESGEKLDYRMVQDMTMQLNHNAVAEEKPSQVTWNEYMRDVGLNSQKANEARSEEIFRQKYKDKIVAWSGKVSSVSEQLVGGGFDVGVSMIPTESALGGSDLTLSASQDFKNAVLRLNKGAPIQFTGRLVRQGGPVTNHEVELMSLGNMAKDVAQGGQNMETKMRQEMDMTWNVQEVKPDGNAVIRQKFDRVKMKMESPYGGFEFDSQSEQAPAGLAAMIAPMYKAMTEGEFIITMSNRGEVMDVKVPEEVVTALKNSPGAAAMGDLATADGFKKMISQGALVLPEKAPSEGDTWTSKVEMKNPMVGTQIVETTYRYQGTKEMDGTTLAVIEPELKMSFGENPQPNVQMKIADQTSSGEVLFNIEEGRLRSSTLKQNVTIDVTAGGQSMKQKIDQTIDVKVSPAGEEDAGADDSTAKSTETDG